MWIWVVTLQCYNPLQCRDDLILLILLYTTIVITINTDLISNTNTLEFFDPGLNYIIVNVCFFINSQFGISIIIYRWVGRNKISFFFLSHPGFLVGFVL